MKNILLFGDSNTWGWVPETMERYPLHVRWAGVLRQLLGADYCVVDDALNGRTTVWNDPIEEVMCGKDYIFPCLKAHAPLDLVVIMLGTNDLKKRFSLHPVDIASGVGALVDKVRQLDGDAPQIQGVPQILVICPPPILETGWLGDLFEGGEAKSRQLSKYFTAMAKAKGVELLDAGTFITSSPVDGIHLSAEMHTKLAQAVAEKIQAIL